MKLKTGVTACGIALGLTGALALGTGVAQAAPYTRTPTLTVSNPNPNPGDTDGVQGLNYAATEAVSIDGHSVPIHLTDVTSDAAGSFTVNVVIPESWRCSQHTIIGTGATGDTASAVVNVQGCNNGGTPGHGHDHDHDHFRGHGDECDSDSDDSDSYDTDSYGPDDCYVGDDDPGPRFADDGDLPSTGAQVAGLGAAGSALIAGGVLLTARRIRRSRKN